MKTVLKTAGLATAIGLTSLGAQAAIYDIDPTHGAARFTVNHMGTSTNAGGFYNLTGVINYDPRNKQGSVDVSIPISSLSTGIKPFDEHLKSADYFHADKYPVANFRSTNWKFNGNKVTEVTGNLKIKDQIHPVTLKATSFNCYDSPIFQRPVCGGDFEARIDRTRWGLDKNSEGLMRYVNLQIQVEGILREGQTNPVR